MSVKFPFMNTMTQSTAPTFGSARLLEALSFAALFAQLVIAMWIVPEWSLRHLPEPVYLATMSSVVVAVLIVGLRLRAKGTEAERLLLALFLGGMPLVYVSSWVLAAQAGIGQLVIELAGVAIFGSLAYLGLKRSPWFLVGGIVAHGLVWDLAHHGHSSFVPDWYALGCLVADVGVGVYAAAQVSAWNARRLARGDRA